MQFSVAVPSLLFALMLLGHVEASDADVGSPRTSPISLDEASATAGNAAEPSERAQTLFVSSVLFILALMVSGHYPHPGKHQNNSKGPVALVESSTVTLGLAMAAGLLGVLKMMEASVWSSLVQTLTTIPQEGVQLVLLAAFFLVLAPGLSSIDNDQTTGKAQIKLVRPGQIAFRLAAVAGLCAIVKLLVSVELPGGTHFILVSSLLLVFAAVIGSDTCVCSQPCKGKTSVQLVKLDAIAFRLGVAAACFGLWMLVQSTVLPSLSAVRSQAVFPSANVVVEASEGVQLMLVGALILIFSAAIGSDDEKDEKPSDSPQKQVELVRPAIIAFRLGLAAVCFGLWMLVQPTVLLILSAVAEEAAEAFRSKAVFPPSNVVVEAPEGVQIMLIGALLLIFSAAIGSDDEKPSESPQKQIELVRPDIIAFRLACVACVVGLAKVVHGTPLWTCVLAACPSTPKALLHLLVKLALLAGMAVGVRDVLSRAFKSASRTSASSWFFASNSKKAS